MGVLRQYARYGYVRGNAAGMKILVVDGLTLVERGLPFKPWA